MKNVYFILDKSYKKYSGLFDQDSLCFVESSLFKSFEKSCPGCQIKKISFSMDSTEKECVDYIEALDSNSQWFEHHNNYYFYGMKYLISYEAMIEQVWHELNGDCKIYLVGGGSQHWFKVYNTGIGENATNVVGYPSDFLHPLIFEKLKQKYDIHLLHTRTSLVRSFSRAFILPFIMFLLEIFKESGGKKSIERNAKYVFIIRSLHHLRETKKMISALGLKVDEYDLIILEQLQEKNLLKTIRNNNLKEPIGLSRFQRIYFCFKALINVFSEVFKAIFKTSDFIYAGFRIKERALAIESAIQFNVFFYHQVLKYLTWINRSVIESSDAIFFSFEQVSPQARVESKIVKNGVPIVGVKSTLIRYVYHPSIGNGCMFLVPYQSEQEKYSSLALAYSGSIKCCGSHKALLKNKGTNISGELRRVLFVSQPIFSDLRYKIVRLLWSLSKELNFELVVRIHPREQGDELYKEIAPSIICEHKNVPLEKSLSNSDLIVSLNSSVLEDCLLMRKPYIACPFYDETNINAVYMDVGFMVARSIDSLEQKVRSFPEYSSTFSIKVEEFNSNVFPLNAECIHKDLN